MEIIVLSLETVLYITYTKYTALGHIFRGLNAPYALI